MTIFTNQKLNLYSKNFILKVTTRYRCWYYRTFDAGVSTEPAEKRLQETEDGQMNENIALRKQSTTGCSSDPSDLAIWSTFMVLWYICITIIILADLIFWNISTIKKKIRNFANIKFLFLFKLNAGKKWFVWLF